MPKSYLLKLFQELGSGDEGKQWKGVNSSMMYLIHGKHLCKATMYPHLAQQQQQKT
jgi:hypothetical protein